MNIDEILNKIDEIRKSREKTSLSSKETRERLIKVFNSKLCSETKDFIEENATVIHNFSKALGGCCRSRHISEAVAVEGDCTLKGGFRITKDSCTMYLDFSEGEGRPKLNITRINLLAAHSVIDEMTASLQSHGFANENAFKALENLLDILVSNFKHYMEGVEDDMDIILGGKSALSRLMKCEKLAHRTNALAESHRSHLVESCIVALGCLENNLSSKIKKTMALVEKFESVFGVFYGLPSIMECITPIGLEIEHDFVEYGMSLALALKKTSGGDYRIDIRPDRWMSREKLHADDSVPPLRNQLHSLVNKNKQEYDPVQLIHLPEMFAFLAERTMLKIYEMEKEISEVVTKYERA